MAKHTDRDALQIFVEMSDRLLNSKFVADLKTRKVGNSIQFTNLGRTMTTSEPDQDMIQAALLTLRMFGQNNDPISFQNISARIAALPVDQALKDEFEKAKNDLNTNLDSPPSVHVQGEPNAATRRLIFDTFSLWRIRAFQRRQASGSPAMEAAAFLLRPDESVRTHDGVFHRRTASCQAGY